MMVRTGTDGSRRGFSLVEVIIALVLFGAGVLAIASVGRTVVGGLKTSRTDVGLWAALQTIGDSLQQRGLGAVTDSSRVVDGYTFRWTVDTSLPDVHVVTVTSSMTEPVARMDTVLIYLR